MSASFIGALVGLAIAAVDFALLRLLASRVDLPETKRVLTVTGIQPVRAGFRSWAGSLAPLFTGE